jgi:hypothetical protein
MWTEWPCTYLAGGAEGSEDGLGSIDVGGDRLVLDNNAHVVVLVARGETSVLLGGTAAVATLVEDADLHRDDGRRRGA